MEKPTIIDLGCLEVRERIDRLALLDARRDIAKETEVRQEALIHREVQHRAAKCDGCPNLEVITNRFNDPVRDVLHLSTQARCKYRSCTVTEFSVSEAGEFPMLKPRSEWTLRDLKKNLDANGSSDYVGDFERATILGTPIRDIASRQIPQKNLDIPDCQASDGVVW